MTDTPLHNRALSFCTFHCSPASLNADVRHAFIPPPTAAWALTVNGSPTGIETADTCAFMSHDHSHDGMHTCSNNREGGNGVEDEPRGRAIPFYPSMFTFLRLGLAKL